MFSKSVLKWNYGIANKWEKIGEGAAFLWKFKHLMKRSSEDDSLQWWDEGENK
jgi:hypothetical protein